MTVAFKVLGFTLASIDVDLGDLLSEPAGASPRIGEPPAVLNTFVKRMSNGWVRRMIA